MPSGAVDDCGSSPRVRATFFAGMESMAGPSSRTRPSGGLSIRDRARSNVDLPQALGPTMTVKEWSGISDRQVPGDDSLVVAEGDRFRGEALHVVLLGEVP